MTKPEAKELAQADQEMLSDAGVSTSLYHAGSDCMYLVAKHNDLTVFEYPYEEDCDG